jgi:hypothetical protein
LVFLFLCFFSFNMIALLYLLWRCVVVYNDTSLCTYISNGKPHLMLQGTIIVGFVGEYFIELVRLWACGELGVYVSRQSICENRKRKEWNILKKLKFINFHSIFEFSVSFINQVYVGFSLKALIMIVDWYWVMNVSDILCLYALFMI